MHRILSSSEWISRIAVPMVPSKFQPDNTTSYFSRCSWASQLKNYEYFNQKNCTSRWALELLFSGERKPHAPTTSSIMLD
ncbi:hypothetical protein OIU84_019128 [Salix udensis]|uniref:Uncharacterized protein n=1 Tax=Salix udensis TaxID=889485 RepID=A0AAD6PJX2_9ROSI|nr:hypothetical protein OIU84_019128 [Salix udensis]